VYIADRVNGRIRLVTVSTGIITTIAGGGTGSTIGGGVAATSISLGSPYGVALDTSGHTYTLIISSSLAYYVLLFIGNVYIAESDNNRVCKVTVSSGIITVFAGTGTASYGGDNGAASSATLYQPLGVSVDSAGMLYFLLPLPSYYCPL
jgi:hypothetical protein